MSWFILRYLGVWLLVFLKHTNLQRLILFEVSDDPLFLHGSLFLPFFDLPSHYLSLPSFLPLNLFLQLIFLFLQLFLKFLNLDLITLGFQLLLQLLLLFFESLLFQCLIYLVHLLLLYSHWFLEFKLQVMVHINAWCHLGYVGSYLHLRGIILFGDLKILNRELYK